MNDDQREKIKEANRHRGSQYCPQCKQVGVQEVDGADCGGMPNIKYRRCNGCGWIRAVTHRQRKFKL